MYIVKSAALLPNGEVVEESTWFYQKFASEDAVFGFLDDCGNFHDRKSAMKIAKSSGQVVSNDEELYAEDLWREPALMED